MSTNLHSSKPQTVSLTELWDKYNFRIWTDPGACPQSSIGGVYTADHQKRFAIDVILNRTFTMKTRKGPGDKQCSQSQQVWLDDNFVLDWTESFEKQVTCRSTFNPKHRKGIPNEVRECISRATQNTLEKSQRTSTRIPKSASKKSSSEHVTSPFTVVGQMECKIGRNPALSACCEVRCHWKDEQPGSDPDKDSIWSASPVIPHEIV